jgi:adenylylsulfate kinase-like enzyme
MIYWLTGQPGAGKTTLANYLYEHYPLGSVIHIDGDDLRNMFDNKDYSQLGRRKNIERAQDIALFMNNKGFNVIVSLVSPYKDQRDKFKAKTNVIEIYVHTNEDRGRNNYHVTDYEPPTHDFIDIDTTYITESDSYYELLKKINIYE